MPTALENILNNLDDIANNPQGQNTDDQTDNSPANNEQAQGANLFTTIASSVMSNQSSSNLAQSGLSSNSLSTDSTINVNCTINGTTIINNSTLCALEDDDDGNFFKKMWQAPWNYLIIGGNSFLSITCQQGFLF